MWYLEDAMRKSAQRSKMQPFLVLICVQLLYIVIFEFADWVLSQASLNLKQYV